MATIFLSYQTMSDAETLARIDDLSLNDWLEHLVHQEVHFRQSVKLADEQLADQSTVDPEWTNDILHNAGIGRPEQREQGQHREILLAKLGFRSTVEGVMVP